MRKNNTLMQSPTLEEIDALYKLREASLREARKKEIERLYLDRDKRPRETRLGPINAEKIIAQECVLRIFRSNAICTSDSRQEILHILQPGKTSQSKKSTKDRC